MNNKYYDDNFFRFEEEILPVVYDLDRLPMTKRNHLLEVHGTNHACCFIHENVSDKRLTLYCHNIIC